MSRLVAARRWPSPGQQLQICRICAQQRRTMSGRAFAKYGPKYQAKIDEANDEWQERRLLIEDGKQQSMWDVLEERGYIKDVAGSPEQIRTLMNHKRIGAYVGIDPTAPSMHVGHLLPMMPLFWMYMNGFRAVTLLGGATGKIGDPTDRLKSRPEMKSAVVAMNMVKIHYQLKKLWENVEVQARRYGYEKKWAWRRGVLQNGHWWNKLPMLEVLQRLGAGLRLGPMLSRDTVKRKLTQGDGMSFAEFSYPLMQAWDWWHMYTRQGIQMQIGGSDQYGNIVTGIDAFKIIRSTEPDPSRRLPEGPLDDPVGFTVPLLTDSSGVKFGKSAGNAIWLDRFETTTFDLYGYFVRRSDTDVEHLLRLFTFLPLPAIRQVMDEHAADPAKRIAQHTLAFEVVALVHGMELAKDAQESHRAMYGKRAVVTEEEVPSDGEAAAEVLESKTPLTLNNAPRVDLQLPESLMRAGKVARILYAAGMVRSVSEGNRLAVQKGAYVGAAPGQVASRNKGMLLTQVDFTPVHLWFPEDTKNFIIDGKYMILRKGQHNVRIIEIVSDEEWEASGKTYPGQPFTGRVRQLRQQLKELKEGVVNVDVAKEDGAPNDSLVFPDEKPAQMRKLEMEIRRELELIENGDMYGKNGKKKKDA